MLIGDSVPLALNRDSDGNIELLFLDKEMKREVERIHIGIISPQPLLKIEPEETLVSSNRWSMSPFLVANGVTSSKTAVIYTEFTSVKIGINNSIWRPVFTH
jgi:hypothetical protein